MFGRRKRAASNPSFSNGATANPSAALAAAQAYLARQTSSASLSAAAAATALRSRPTSPTSVADVQTKRTMRRSNSNSSMGNSVAGSARGRPGGQLERKDSSGSMTERTFRDPSPNEGSHQQQPHDAPPVPAIPKNIMSAPRTRLPRRTMSVESPPRIGSERGSSLGPARSTQPPRRSGLGQRAPSLPSVQELTSAERPESRGFVNFSYPTSSDSSPYKQRQLTSPTPQSADQKPVPTPRQSLVYDPNTRRLLPEAETLFYKHDLQDVADRPVKKKNNAARQSAAGTHLAEGTVGGRIRGTAVDTTEVDAAQPAQKIETPQRQPASASNTVLGRRVKARNESNSERDQYSTSDYDSDSSGNVKYGSAGRASTLSKKPTLVREVRELEDAEDESIKFLGRQAALDRLESSISEDRVISPSPSPRSGLGRGYGRGKALSSASHGLGPQQAQSISQPAHSSAQQPNNAPQPEFPSAEASGQAANRAIRVQSVSPVRNAHFLAAPESLATRHQPPPRSVSPRKSAMKHSPSRDGSPIGNSPLGHGIGYGQSLGEVSDTSTARSDERMLSQKKSVRVSFDDESNVVLGQSDTSPTDSPITSTSQNKRGWYIGMGRGRNRDFGSADDFDDETMQPRPALPSFGSMREKMNRNFEDRALVGAAIATASLSSRSISTTSNSDPAESSTGHSNDHALGAILSQDQISKNSMSREPLPPEVTSVEGSGYVSDNDSSICSLDKPENIASHLNSAERTRVNDPCITDRSPTVPSKDHDRETSSRKLNGNGNIPTLAITQATPTLESSENKMEWPNIPGGFPGSPDSSQDDDGSMQVVSHHPTDPTLASLGISEPDPVGHPATLPVGTITTENVHSAPASEEETESDEESIYSDAAEDLSDLEGDGFLSLDAVMKSPIPPSISALAITMPPESPTVKTAKYKARQESQQSRDLAQPGLDEGWDQTQEHESTLTTENIELERTPLEEIGDVSGEEKPAPKPKRKRVVVRSPDRDLQIPRSGPTGSQDRTYQISPGARADSDSPARMFKSPMRATTADASSDGNIRKSMRANGLMRESMGESPRVSSPITQPRVPLQAKPRPMPPPTAVASPGLVGAKKHSRNINTGAGPVGQNVPRPTPALRRSGSGDSKSSFKRARPATAKYSIKSSMRSTEGRSQSSQDAASNLHSSRFSLRSLSPTGSRPSSAVASPPVGLSQKTMRRSQRFPNQSGTPTLRSTPPGRTKSPLHVPGFGRSKSESKGRMLPTRASRFADSSDEDVRPSFRSRFADSSDEDEVPVLRLVAPPSSSIVRGIPQAGAADGDSSDLPDSDDEKLSGVPQSTRPTSSPSTNTMPANGGGALASNSSNRIGSGYGFTGPATTTSITGGTSIILKQKRRVSVMSILRRKKPDSLSKVRKSDIESAARRDTSLERSRSDLLAVKRQDSNVSTGGRATSPKLQKRNGPKWSGSVNWPLQSPSPATTANDWSHTASSPEASGSGLNGTGNPLAPDAAGRPDIDDAHTKVKGLASVDLGAVLPPRRRKRFQMLRRAFRLDD